MKTFLIFLCVLIYATYELEALSCKQIKAFVDGHNLRRLMVAKGEILGQPPAFDMKLMVWDDELAAKAAFWAAQNLNFHNPDKSIPSGRFETGENLFEYSTTDINYELDVEEVLGAWFNEYRNYIYRPIQDSDFNLDDNAQIGHYTQMIWSDTLYVGCAVSQTIEDDWNKFFVVCNYGPTGNYRGKFPYKAGSGNSALICDCEENDTNCYCNKRYGSRC